MKKRGAIFIGLRFFRDSGKTKPRRDRPVARAVSVP